MNMLEIRVGEGIVARTPEIITSSGLGSCIVVTLYDLRQKIGGMAHIMLPYSIQMSDKHIVGHSRENGNPELMKLDSCWSLSRTVIRGRNDIYRFADTAVASLLKEMLNEGARIQDIIAKIIGGARMFEFDGDNQPRIGEQNILGVLYILKKEGIPVIGKDIGGHHGRSVEFRLDSGKVVVKAIGMEDSEI